MQEFWHNLPINGEVFEKFLCKSHFATLSGQVVFFGLLLLHYLNYSLSLKTMKDSEAQHILERLGALEFDPQLQTASYYRMRALLEGICIAGGYGIPRLFLLPQESSINAMMIAPNQHQSYFLVTQGVIDKLNEEEKSALITYFLGDLHIGRTTLLTKMYFENSMVTWSYHLCRTFWKSGFFSKIISAILYPYGILCFVIAHRLRSIFVKNTYFIADRYGCYFFEKPPHLSNVFAKIILDGRNEGALQKADATGLAHLFFVNPLTPSALQPNSLFPSIMSRIGQSGVVPRGLESHFPAATMQNQYQKKPVGQEVYFYPDQWTGRIHEAGFTEARLFLDSLHTDFYQHIHTPEGGYWLTEQVFGIVPFQGSPQGASSSDAPLTAIAVGHKRALMEIATTSLRRVGPQDRKMVVTSLWEKLQKNGIYNCFDLGLFFNLRASLLPWHQRGYVNPGQGATVIPSLELVFSYLSWLVLENQPKKGEDAQYLFELAVAELKGRRLLNVDLTFRALNTLSPILFIDTLVGLRFLDLHLREGVFQGFRAIVFGTEGDYESSWELLRLLAFTLETVVASSPKVLEVPQNPSEFADS
jgi:Zn-dependent protease with chaperone function